MVANIVVVIAIVICGDRSRCSPDARGCVPSVTRIVVVVVMVIGVGDGVGIGVVVVFLAKGT